MTWFCKVPYTKKIMKQVWQQNICFRTISIFPYTYTLSLHGLFKKKKHNYPVFKSESIYGHIILKHIGCCYYPQFFRNVKVYLLHKMSICREVAAYTRSLDATRAITAALADPFNKDLAVRIAFMFP